MSSPLRRAARRAAALSLALTGCTASADKIAALPVGLTDPLDPAGVLRADSPGSTASAPRGQSPGVASASDPGGIQPVTFRKPAGSAQVTGHQLPDAAASRPPARESLATPGGGEAEYQVRIIAVVGSTPIFQSELDEAVQRRILEFINLPAERRDTRKAEIRAEEMDALIARELMLKALFDRLEQNKATHIIDKIKSSAEEEAEKRLLAMRKAKNLPDDAALDALLAPQGLSVAGLKRFISRTFMSQNYLVSNAILPKMDRLTLGDVRQYYLDHPKEFRTGDEVKWQDIFIPYARFGGPAEARRFADSLTERARRGEDFAALAREHDAGDSVLRGGYGMGEKPDEIRPAELAPAILALREGEVSEPVESGLGLHVIRVDRRSYAGQRPFDREVQEEIRGKFRQRLSEREYKRVVAELRAATPVVVYGP